MATLAVQASHLLPLPTTAAAATTGGLHETADATEAVFLKQLPDLAICTEILPESDGIKARIVERLAGNVSTEKIIIGYYDGGNWVHRRWAFAPLRSGQVPTMKGSSLDSWISTWLRDHVVAGFYGPITGTRYCAEKSGGEFGYATSSDENNRKYILIPANGQDGFTGYVPARDVQTSLKNGYLVDPENYKLIYDNSGGLHLACRTINYENHGFELHGKVWCPVKMGVYGDYAVELERKVEGIEQKVRKYLGVILSEPPFTPTVQTVQSPLNNLEATHPNKEMEIIASTNDEATGMIRQMLKLQQAATPAGIRDLIAENQELRLQNQIKVGALEEEIRESQEHLSHAADANKTLGRTVGGLSGVVVGGGVAVAIGLGAPVVFPAAGVGGVLGMAMKILCCEDD